MTFNLLVAATLASGLLIGLIPTLIDSVLQPSRDRLPLLEGQDRKFVALFYAAWLPAMPLAGLMIDYWPLREILIAGLFLLILAVAALSLAASAKWLLLDAIVIGCAYSCITVATVRLMTYAFFPEYIDRYKLNIASLNLGFVAVGLGALVGPWMVKGLEHLWGFRQGLLYFGIALILPAVLVVVCSSELFPGPNSGANLNDQLLRPQMILMSIAVLLYFAIENCLEFWPESHLKELGYESQGRQINLLIFWLAFIAARAGTAWLLYEYPNHAIAFTIAVVALSAAVIGNLTGGFEVGSGSFGFWLLGACYGPILPGLLGMAMDLNALPVSALGFLLAMSGLDTLAVRPLMKWFGKDRPARSVMLVPTILALVLAAPLLFLAFLRY